MSDRIHLLNDHKKPAPTKAEQAREQIVQIVEHYMAQLPEYVGVALNAGMAAYDAGRRDEFAAFVGRLDGHSPETMAVISALLDVFGPRKPMPAQPEQDS